MLQLSYPPLLQTPLVASTAETDVSVIPLPDPHARLSRPRDAEPLIQEHLVHILQTPPRRFRIEKPCDGDEAGVEDSPDDVQAILEIVDGTRGDEDDDEVGEPVGADAEGDAFVAGA